MGGAALHFGWVAEMKTGEGKTLVATLPALPQRARRPAACTSSPSTTTWPSSHAEWMGRIYRLPRARGRASCSRRSTTATRSARRTRPTSPTAPTTSSGSTTSATTWPVTQAEQVQRGHFFAIVDEVDSILIDEARTPLIISGRADDAQELYDQFAAVVKDLQRDRDYEVDEAKRTVVPTEEGVDRVEQALERRQPLRAREPELRAPAPGGAARQGAVQARRRLRRAATAR